MTKLPREPLFYLFSIPISFLAGYGYATSLWVLNNKKFIKPYSLPDYDI